MRIDSSTISMGASRVYTAEAMESTTTITRLYQGDEAVGASVNTTTAKITQQELECSGALFTTSSDGMTCTDQAQFECDQNYSRELAAPRRSTAQVFSVPSTENWFSALTTYNNSYLKQLMQFLEKLTGGKIKWRGPEGPSAPSGQSMASAGFRFSASQASARYQEVVAMLNGETSDIGGANAAIAGQALSMGGSGATNGHWTRQTVQSGFVSGQETTAFCSRGTVVTAAGRSIDFNISLEMSRSFEAAYVSVGKEEVYTDPLVINMDTDAAELSDVSFRFDLNCDGVEEEMSALEGSGFLALDKNGDGTVNNGSELFGARTGDGFGELAQYDQDGNGWIDEGDDVFSQLKVWVKCGESGAKLLSLSEADVGAIFLGNQNTQYSLMDAYGETGAMVRKTGLYLRESGSVGTVQHVDFKT